MTFAGDEVLDCDFGEVTFGLAGHSVESRRGTEGGDMIRSECTLAQSGVLSDPEDATRVVVERLLGEVGPLTPVWSGTQYVKKFKTLFRFNW